MGSAITAIVEKRPLKIEELKGKKLAVDAFNQLYMFVTTIRGPDGTPLKDSKGRITSHLSGIFFRFAKLMEQGIEFAFVFDGEMPKLKEKERQRRSKLKEEALRAFKEAKQREDIAEMKKYAGRSTSLSKEMLEEAKALIKAMGCPIIDAPTEGEAQATQLVKEGKCYAVMSQDADALLFGAPRTIKNLSITGRKKKPGSYAYYTIEPELILLEENLKALEVNQDELIRLGMLVGTDYNVGGIKGIGPKKALALIQKHLSAKELFEEAKWDEHLEVSWKDVFEAFKEVKVKKDLEIKWGELDKEEIIRILCKEHEFSKERVQKTLDNLKKSMNKEQKGLGEFF